MDPVAPVTNLSSVAKTITKILRFRRNTNSRNSRTDFSFEQDDELPKHIKQSKLVEDYSKPLPKSENDPSCSNQEALESLLANLFASVSAIKASYAQLQVAQSPYDPDTIQSADQSVVNELKHLSKLKHAYLSNQVGPPPPPPLAAQIQEHRNLIKTYQITTKKLESDLRSKESEILALQSRLMETDRQNRSLESVLHPGTSLASLDGLHLSGLDPTHFLAALRYAVRSVKSFVKMMIGEMESAGWDTAAAASSIQPDVRGRPGHGMFAFESFVCGRLFSDFHRRDFGLSGDRADWERRQFFDEFTIMKPAKTKQLLRGGSSGFLRFCRAKYLTTVHPRMEASFFGDLDQRGIVSTGRGFPESDFFLGFVEMARRVWMLHCLFFSFAGEMEGSIFQARRGERFSEVFMESVLDAELEGVRTGPAIAFTVVPGFKVGKTVIQCKVYPSGLSGNRRP